MIDIHSHILPGIDDGSESDEITINMLRQAIDDGTSSIFATSHYFKAYYENCYEKIVKSVEHTRKLAHDNGLDIDIIPGQEIFLDTHTLEFYSQGILNGYNGTNILLVEFDLGEISDKVHDIIYELKIKGAEIVIAHPERYQTIIDKPETINAFIDDGCYFQINAGSIMGSFGKKVKNTAELLIINGICSFIASDAHDASYRKPCIKKSFEKVKLIDPQLYDDIILNTEEFLSGTAIRADYNKINKRRKLFSFKI